MTIFRSPSRQLRFASWFRICTNLSKIWHKKVVNVLFKVTFNDTSWWYQAVPVSRFSFYIIVMLWEIKIFGSWVPCEVNFHEIFQLKSEFKKSLSEFNNKLLFLSCSLNKSMSNLINYSQVIVRMHEKAL